jgi:hypothetical protein
VNCQVCRSSVLQPGLDVGAHPVSSHFAKSAGAKEAAFPMALGQCANCGAIGLLAPVPHSALVPPYDWLFAREPEDHLDRVAGQLAALPGITSNSVIAGLTSKDDTTLDRFRKLGFDRVWRVDLARDLGIANPCANIETVQKLTTPATMQDVAASHGAADILLVRHIIEHAEDLGTFVEGCAALVKPGGYIVVELPDCTTSLRLADYAMIWEEHALYFVPETFAGVLAYGGFETVRTDIYPLPFENCIVEIARKTGKPHTPLPTAAGRATLGQLENYATRWQPAAADLRSKLTGWRKTRGPLALFGAGHLACAFVNYHGLADLIEFVADDTPQKQGLYLPGSRLPIVPSQRLLDDGVTLALLALSIGNEDRVIERNAAFIDKGGQFASIFAASPRSLRAMPAA